MVNNKLVAVDEETHREIESYKIHSREPMGDVVKKIFSKYKELEAKETTPTPNDPTPPATTPE